MKIKFIIPLLLLFCLNGMAQEKDKRDQIKALKVSFLTTQLNLSSDESAKFWPVYSAFEEKRHDIRSKKIRPLIKKIEGTGIDKISDKEALNYLNQFEEADEEIFLIQKKLVSDLKPIIGPAKILKLKKAEEDFNRKLLSKYKGNRKK